MTPPKDTQTTNSEEWTALSMAEDLALGIMPKAKNVNILIAKHRPSEENPEPLFRAAMVEDRSEGGTHLLTRMPPAHKTRLEALMGLREIVEEDAAKFMDNNIDLWRENWNRAHKDDKSQHLGMAEDGTLQDLTEVKKEEERRRKQVLRDLDLVDDDQELSDVPDDLSDEGRDGEAGKTPATKAAATKPAASKAATSKTPVPSKTPAPKAPEPTRAQRKRKHPGA